MMNNAFKSKLEELMPAEELLFDPTPAFGEYKKFLEHAIAHPAKMNTKLLEFLIKKFTSEGDVVLDPMAGSGSTGVVAALYGRNAICVELEKKFYKWMEKARENVEKHPTLTPKGKIVNICGDARKLSELLSRADVCITSPPYAKSDMRKSKLFLKMREQPGSNWFNRSLDGNAVKYYLSDGYETRDNIGNLPHGDIDVVVTSPPYSEGIGHDSGDNASTEYEERLEMQRRYTRQMITEGNIAKLKHGSIDAVITSPPYASPVAALPSGHKGVGSDDRYKNKPISEHRINLNYSESKNNIGNLSYRDVDVVITSPPYSDIEKRDRSKESWWDEERERKKAGGSINIAKGYQASEGNIGNLPLGKVDAILTSPPYSDTYSIREGGQVNKEYVERRRKKLIEKGMIDIARNLKVFEYNTQNPANIGNLHHGEIDAVITSPPYEGSLSDKQGGGILTREGAGPKTEATATRNLLPVKYSKSKQNIGNMTKETYLEAMLKVYGEM